MGDLLTKQGKYDAALPYYTEALETRRRTLGDEHPGTLSSISNMGDLLTKQGKYDAALPYMQESIQFALQNPQDSKALNDAAWRLADSGLPPAWFEKLADDCLAASQRSCELTEYQYPMYLDTLARVHFERGELDEAIKWQETAVELADGKQDVTPEALDRYRAAKQAAENKEVEKEGDKKEDDKR